MFKTNNKNFKNVKIKNFNLQHRRDFWADMVCEHCGHVEKDVKGYDDDFFHQNVIPNKECKNCGKKAPDDYIPMKTKYEAYEII